MCRYGTGFGKVHREYIIIKHDTRNEKYLFINMSLLRFYHKRGTTPGPEVPTSRIDTSPMTTPDIFYFLAPCYPKVQIPFTLEVF